MNAPLTISPAFAGNLVGHLGHSAFSQKLWDWAQESVKATLIVAARCRRTGQERHIECVDLLFYMSSRPSEFIDPLVRRYQFELWQHDPTLPYLEKADELQLVLLNHGDIRSGLYRRYAEQSQMQQECTLIGCADGDVYALSLYRGSDAEPFLLSELSYLREIGNFVIPLIAQHVKHASQIVCADERSIVELFSKRVVGAGVRLSPQERLACEGILTGKSGNAIAEALHVKPSTVKTYVERAFVKLNIKNRPELFVWCLLAAAPGN